MSGWFERVEKHIATIRFGTVRLTVHDSKAVQIETSEKVCFDKPAGKPGR